MEDLKQMAQRTIYERDRCHAQWEPERDRPNDFPPQWSIGQSLGVTRFILCESCTEAFQRFLHEVPPVPVLSTIAASIENLTLKDEDDHAFEDTATSILSQKAEL